MVCTQSPGIQRTKGIAAMLLYTTKECNYNSIVIVHQHGSYDVTFKPRIERQHLFSFVLLPALNAKKLCLILGATNSGSRLYWERSGWVEVNLRIVLESNSCLWKCFTSCSSNSYRQILFQTMINNPNTVREFRAGRKTGIFAESQISKFISRQDFPYVVVPKF